VSLTTAQRQAALAYLATVSDDTLASLTWQAVSYNEDISADVAEVCAMHCDEVVRTSLLNVDNANLQHRDNARSNVERYGFHAKRFRAMHKELEIEVTAELVGAQ
jgi:hypothetical protein